MHKTQFKKIQNVRHVCFYKIDFVDASIRHLMQFPKITFNHLKNLNMVITTAFIVGYVLHCLAALVHFVEFPKYRLE